MTKKPPIPPPNNGKNDFNGFVNYNLTNEDKEFYRAEWLGQHVEVTAQYLQQLVDAGYKITLSYSPQYEAYSATMMCTDKAHRDYGWCLSGKAGADVTEAINVLFFKHYHCLKEKWYENGRKVGATKGDIS